MPATTAEPAVGAISVPSVRTVVVLPAPFGPRKPNTSPHPTLNETSDSAVRSPKRLVSPSTVIASSPACPRRGDGVDASARSLAIAATCSGVRSTGSRAAAAGASSTASPRVLRARRTGASRPRCTRRPARARRRSARSSRAPPPARRSRRRRGRRRSPIPARPAAGSPPRSGGGRTTAVTAIRAPEAASSGDYTREPGARCTPGRTATRAPAFIAHRGRRWRPRHARRGPSSPASPDRAAGRRAELGARLSRRRVRRGRPRRRCRRCRRGSAPAGRSPRPRRP